MVCDFCGKETDADKVDKSAKSYTCGDCVAYLGSRDQGELLKGYLFALGKGYLGKAKTIESFLEVNTDEPVNRDYVAKRANGKRPVRAAWNEERTGRGFKKQKRITLYQGKPEKQALL